MADIFKELAKLPGTLEAKLEGIQKSFEGSVDAAREMLATMYSVFSTVGDFFAWMGLHAMLLLIATLIALYLIGMVSPLERKANYLVALLVGSVIAYLSHFPMAAYGRYLLVMGIPFVLMLPEGKHHDVDLKK